jgi:signal transduction histidine kinase
LDLREKPSKNFLAMLGHDLRNSIAPLRSATEILHLVCAEPVQQHALGIIDRQIKQLMSLLDNLSEDAKLCRGLVNLEKQFIDFSMVVEQALVIVKPLIEAKGQYLQISLPSSSVFLMCDALRLVQILRNLLDNAVRYTPYKGNITLDIMVEGNILKMEVTDNGRGIRPELLPYIFNFFEEGHQLPLEQKGSCGIGLAIVRDLVKMHSGSVGAKSEGPEKGSTFIVRLPLADKPTTGTRASNLAS